MFEFFDFLNNKEACRAFFEEFRWPNGVHCPHCKHTKVYTLKSGYKCANNTCYKKFNSFTETPLQNTKLELNQWYLAKYLISTIPSGMSTYQLAKKVGIRQKTAWHLHHRICEFFDDRLDAKLSGVIQIDEAVLGGKNQFRHWDKKFAWKKGEAGKDKTWVFGLTKQDERYVKMIVVPDRKAKTLRAIIDNYIEPGSTIVTDDYIGYNSLNNKYNHKIVKIKKKGKFKYKTEDGFHTNRVEGSWTPLKRCYKGTYYHMSPQHAQSYCHEVAFRYQHGGNPDYFIFETVMQNIPNVVLRFKDLVARKMKTAA